MICPNCQMQQPQENLAYCVRCNYPLQSRPQGFFTKSSQTGYSRADAYSATRRGQQSVSYPAQPPVQSAPPPGNIQMMYDQNGNQIYVQTLYDQNGNPMYIQMIPQVTGQDAYGNPVITMIPVQNQRPVSVPMPQPQPQQRVSYVMPQQTPGNSVSPPVSRQVQRPSVHTSVPAPAVSGGNSEFAPKQNEPPTPVPVMPRPGQQPIEESSIPDRPAMRASAIASSMYTANTPSEYGTGSFFARVRQQQNPPPAVPMPERNHSVQQNPPSAVPIPERNHSVYEMPVSAEELLEESGTAFLPSDMPDENAVLEKIFGGKSKEYRFSNAGTRRGTFSVRLSGDEVTNVTEKTIYQNQPKTTPEPPAQPEPVLKHKNKKSKDQPKHKTIIVDPDEIFGDSKRKTPEMLGIRVDGTDDDVSRTLKEMKNNGKKSVRSMKSAEQALDLEAVIDDPLKGDAARRVLEEQAYESYESAEIEKALEMLNQGIFPKNN